MVTSEIGTCHQIAFRVQFLAHFSLVTKPFPCLFFTCLQNFSPSPSAGNARCDRGHDPCVCSLVPAVSAAEPHDGNQGSSIPGDTL